MGEIHSIILGAFLMHNVLRPHVTQIVASLENDLPGADIGNKRSGRPDPETETPQGPERTRRWVLRDCSG